MLSLSLLVKRCIQIDSTQCKLQKTWTNRERRYKNGKIDGEVWGPWPGSSLHFRQLLEEPRWEDYEIEYHHSNRFKFLGNGRTEEEMTEGDVAYFLTEPPRTVREES